ncbi:MAG TPA: N-6 DNA methylase [Phycisphaerae bacterium]|nr:N-6 DNA methylase [Phycisphaerae bacterium]
MLSASVVPSEKNSATSRRDLGQVFTPAPVAEWMVRWALSDQPRRILDPAVGPGVFIEAIQKQFFRQGKPKIPQIDAYDIDGRMIRVVGGRGGAVAVRLHQRDFVTSTIRESYDAVVANPPYVRHHGFEYPETLWRRYDRLCGRRLSRLTNLYGLFLLRIWASLSPRGRAAVILPAEWLNADFGVPVKAHLLEENALDTIVHFDPAAGIFDGALTTSAIVLLRSGRPKYEPVRLCQVANVSALSRLDLSRGEKWRRADLDPAAKWSRLFASHRRPSHPAARLGEVASCVRGIATGANQFFTVSESVRRLRRIDRRDVVPCVTKARQLQAAVATPGVLRRLVKADDRVFLLSPRQPLSREVRAYLREGRRLGVHHRYLCAHRPTWYLPERRRPAPILVSVFARERFRFVLNRAGVLNLTAFHGIFPRTNGPRAVRLLFDYLASDAGQEELRRHCRVYGDGLLKVEPRDVEAMAIPAALAAIFQGSVQRSKRTERKS